MKSYIIILVLLALITTPCFGYTIRDKSDAPIPTIKEEYFVNLSNSFGVNNTTSNGNVLPDFSRGIWIAFTALTHEAGIVGFVLLLSPPFLMMIIANGNVKLAGIIGIIVSPFVFMYITSNWMIAGVFGIIMAITAIIWYLYRRVTKQ